MSLKKRQIIFGIAVIVIIAFVITLSTIFRGKTAEETAKAEKGNVSVTKYDPNDANSLSANGPDALTYSKGKSRDTTSNQKLKSKESDIPDPSGETRYPVEQFDAAYDLAIKGLIEYRTVYSSETVAQYQERVSPYFVPGSSPLQNIQAVDNDDDQPVAFDSEVELNYSFSNGDLPENGIKFQIGVVSRNQVKDLTTSDIPSVFQTDDTYIVDTVLGDDGQWRISDLNETDE